MHQFWSIIQGSHGKILPQRRGARRHLQMHLRLSRKQRRLRHLLQNQDDALPLMEAIRSGGDLTALGGDSKYTKNIVCPDGCVIFKLTATPLGNENFHKGGFWDYPDETT